MDQGFEMNILLCKPKYVVVFCCIVHSFIERRKEKNYVTFVIFSLMNENDIYSERLFSNVSQIILLSYSYRLEPTLDSGINIGVLLLIFGICSLLERLMHIFFKISSV